MSEPEQKPKLPLAWRVILKFPRLSLDGFSDRFHGFFWIVILPVFLFCTFFGNLLILTCIPVPFNVGTAVAVDMLIAFLLLRILVERVIKAYESIASSASFKWDMEKSLEDYMRILKKNGNDEKD
ncbi:MAG: hypothetical protein QHH24_06045 [Candidatus Bathyarchaeota archaeon]|nr:hypothetical protein [Candidatus Bathyarchaeota archaeon]